MAHELGEKYPFNECCFVDSLVTKLRTLSTMKFNVILSSAAFVMLLMVGLVVSCKKTDGPWTGGDSTPPKELITLERANQMFKAYQERHKVVTDFRQGNEDATYGWHSIEFYKNYITYLEAESVKKKIKISGLRLYYVAYPEDKKSGEYSGYQTYIYVPTYFDEKTKKHIAFDPNYLDDNGTPLPIHGVITSTDSTATGLNENMRKVALAGFIATGNATVSSVANMGEMCKPNCSE